MENPMRGDEISPAMQRAADEGMQQAKKAFDMYIAGVRQAFRAFGGDNPIVAAGERALNLAERNIAVSFAFAQRFVQVRNFQEVLRLQAEYLTSQMHALMEHTADLGYSLDKAFVQKAKRKQD